MRLFSKFLQFKSLAPARNTENFPCREDIRNTKIATVVDEFTYASYDNECILRQLSPNNFVNELNEFRPHLLFVESAWRGKDDLWKRKISYPSKEIKSVIKWCNKNNVPTIFWNKEDPVHFNIFIKTALLFDYIFTTDVDSIPAYLEQSSHENVFWLPFAAQPQYSNPIEKYERKHAMCFAGSYYVKYEERSKNLSDILDALQELCAVEIYDRNYGKNVPDFTYPEKYTQFIQGSLPFDKIDLAYKGYKYSLNLNTVKQSQSMFARRIFETAASNTFSFSNYSRALRLLFGDLIVSSDDSSEIKRQILMLESDDFALKERELLALRKVMSSHTYEDRLVYILNTIFDLHLTSPRPYVAIFSYVTNAQQVESLLISYKRQKYECLNLYLIVPEEFYALSMGCPSDDIKIIKTNDLLSNYLTDVIDSETYVSYFCADDYYGEYYIHDLMLARKYTDAEAFGKPQEQPQYTFRESLPIRSAIFSTECLANIALFNDIEAIQDLIVTASSDTLFFVTDNFSYKRENEFNFGADTGNQHLVNVGLDISDVTSAIRHSNTLSGQSYHFSANEFYSNLDGVKKTGVSIRLHNSQKLKCIQIKSDLSKNKSKHIYTDVLKIEKSGLCKIIINGIVSSTEGLDIFVVFYEKNKKISLNYVDLNFLNNIYVPSSADGYKIGFKVVGKTDFRLHGFSVYLDGLPIDYKVSAMMISQYFPNNIYKNDMGIAQFIGKGAGQFSEYYSSHKLNLNSINMSDGSYIYAKSINRSNFTFSLFYYDAAGQIIGTFSGSLNNYHLLDIPRIARSVSFGYRIESGTQVQLEYIRIGTHIKPSVPLVLKDSCILLTSFYPSYENIYKRGFIHSRMKEYSKRGRAFDVMCIKAKGRPEFREFGNVDVITANHVDIAETLNKHEKLTLLIHILMPEMWAFLENSIDNFHKVIIWLHGAEVQPWHRRQFDLDTSEKQAVAVKNSDERANMWRAVFEKLPENVQLVTVSNYLKNQIIEDYDAFKIQDNISVIHNPISTDLFVYHEKSPEMRKKLLSVRPYSSKIYANDLFIEAILLISKETWFDELEIKIVGDGIYFDELTEPLKKFSNVRLYKGYLLQNDIAALHRQYGVFLCPSRSDTQGVSRDEAMSSGLVPITNKVAAIPEFVDETCGMLAEAEDVEGIADAIRKLYHDPELYLRLSKAAAERVRRQSAADIIIPQEMALFR